jgi:nucleoid DNA-binding protein
MTGKTVTRAEIAESLRKKCNLKREDAFQAIEVILQDMVSLLKKDEEIKVPLFGVFYRVINQNGSDEIPKPWKKRLLNRVGLLGFVFRVC